MPVLDEQLSAEFDRRGVVCLRGVFAEDDAARMRQRVWARLARFGVVEDDPCTRAAATAAIGAMVGSP